VDLGGGGMKNDEMGLNVNPIRLRLGLGMRGIVRFFRVEIQFIERIYLDLGENGV